MTVPHTTPRLPDLPRLLSRPRILAMSLGLALVLAAAPTIARAPTTSASAALIDGMGQDGGYALIRLKGDTATLTLNLRGVSPGEHGLHLHATGTCALPGFTSAGPHLNPGAHKHGTLNPEGPHLGDIPNVTADADGRINTTIALRGSGRALIKALFDDDGSAIVLHASADDYKTDPSGNSGGRIACGTVKPG